MNREQASRGSHGRKGCVIRVPDEGTSGEKVERSERAERGGCGGADSAHRNATPRRFKRTVCERLVRNYDEIKEASRRDATATHARFPKLPCAYF